MYARVATDCLDDLTDTALIERFKDGHDEALDVLIGRHSDALYRFCCHLVPTREDAEDICQESLTRAIDRVDSLQTGTAFRSWLFRIARNLSVDAFRRRRRVCPMPDEDVTPLPLHVDGPHDRVEVGEERQTVAEALNNLAQSHQRVLVLREVEDLSYAEIAQRLDISRSAVETLLFRARRRLREEYGKRDRWAPYLGVLAGMRTLALRLADPLSRGPAMPAKLAMTAALIGGAAVTTHELPKSIDAPQLGHPAQHVAARQSQAQRVTRPTAALAMLPPMQVRASGSMLPHASPISHGVTRVPAVRPLMRRSAHARPVQHQLNDAVRPVHGTVAPMSDTHVATAQRPATYTSASSASASVAGLPSLATQPSQSSAQAVGASHPVVASADTLRPTGASRPASAGPGARHPTASYAPAPGRASASAPTQEPSSPTPPTAPSGSPVGAQGSGGPATSPASPGGAPGGLPANPSYQTQKGGTGTVPPSTSPPAVGTRTPPAAPPGSARGTGRVAPGKVVLP